jgi:hypothetical protein
MTVTIEEPSQRPVVPCHACGGAAALDMCGPIFWLWVKEGEKLPSRENPAEKGDHVPLCYGCFQKYKGPDSQ